MIDTISHVNREVSKEMGIDESLVKSINAFYWKSLKKDIGTAEHTSLRINRLGTFVMSRNKLWVKIRRLIREIRYFRSSEKDFKRKTKEEYIEDRLSELRILLQRRNEVAIIYKHNADELKRKLNAKKNLGE